jgi:hypothetical protein
MYLDPVGDRIAGKRGGTADLFMEQIMPRAGI